MGQNLQPVTTFELQSLLISSLILGALLRNTAYSNTSRKGSYMKQLNPYSPPAMDHGSQPTLPPVALTRQRKIGERRMIACLLVGTIGFAQAGMAAYFVSQISLGLLGDKRLVITNNLLADPQLFVYPFALLFMAGPFACCSSIAIARKQDFPQATLHFTLGALCSYGWYRLLQP